MTDFAMHMSHLQSDSNHISANSKPSYWTVHIWSVSAGGNNPLIIGFNITAKSSYQADNIKNEHVSADTDIWWLYIVHPLL